MHIDDITAGESWAARFRTQAMVTPAGTLARTEGLQPGEICEGAPGVYESIGVIKTRDRANKCVCLIDTLTGKEFVVGYDDVWDCDTVEWQDQ